ncbi:hypothetical protein EGI26_18690 [Lacihabitans sp. CCS-44]|uniref:hypothetical protein n=1 Tax=Lacihabitans sp. CCS-44 TaxID=2487331 RepID=UPI0020CF9359|nr:hypothetical protein [Lacihabitans sp. CCS-44]MCP9757192.1 hypothetical protein [Lacihabitans sp. CCS-44]
MKNKQISINTILYLFIGIWLTSVIGFHTKYSSKFPDFEGVTPLIHFHGTVMMLWYVLLFAQVLLIKFNKNSWHKTLGLFGFILAPLVVYSTLLVTRMQYYRELPIQGEAGILGHFTIEIPLMIFFTTFFVLAMVNRKNPYAHTRYIIATALTFIGPGLGRAIIFMSGLHPLLGLASMLLTPTIVAAIFWYSDYKNKRNIKPFRTITLLLACQIVCFAIQKTIIWQSFAKGFVELLF